MKVIQFFRNETQLIGKAVENHRGAQQRLYDLHSGKMLSVCRMYIKDLHHAEEVMLSGFLKVFTHLGTFKNEGSFEGWVRRIMIRESISWLRSNKKVEFPDEEWENTGESYSNIQSDSNVEEIQRLIDNLPEGYRIVFVMYAIEGYKHQEISEMLGISIGTSKSQLSKARKMLQGQLITQNKTGYGTK